ncbi:MAG: phosphoglycerate dehydrogenase [Chthonomonadales bacterium]|nr:phosphoglycerate dehydrogenase [Chthonomonadales bacterium]
MGWRVLVTARAFWDSGEAARRTLEEAGCSLFLSPRAGPVPEDELIPLLRDRQAVIASSDPYGARLFAECPELALVARCGVGLDGINLAAATDAGVLVTNTPGAMTEAVADYTFALLLAAARRVAECDAAVRAGGWGEFPGTLVFGKTLGIVGLGRIGQAVAARAGGFRMRVLGFDPAGPALLPGVERIPLAALLAESDFVTLHVPSTPATTGMVGAAFLAAMKPGAYLVNTARGALVDEEALLDALASGRLAGAALDVFAREPLSDDHPFRTDRRCVLSSHNAFNAREAALAMSARAAVSVVAVARGERPDDVCNPEVLASPRLRARLA